MVSSSSDFSASINIVPVYCSKNMWITNAKIGLWSVVCLCFAKMDYQEKDWQNRGLKWTVSYGEWSEFKAKDEKRRRAEQKNDAYMLVL